MRAKNLVWGRDYSERDYSYTRAAVGQGLKSSQITREYIKTASKFENRVIVYQRIASFPGSPEREYISRGVQGDFRFWAQFIRKSVNHRVMQFHFNPSETLPRIAKNEEVSVTV